jgi:hypothetical protein
MSLCDAFFYVLGIGFLLLAKVKNILQGYSSPKPFAFSDTARCIEYDIRVVERWLCYLQQHSKNVISLDGMNVLELGPGSDLGIGIYLLSKGCLQYNACDVNDLMKFTPDSFYEQFFLKLESINHKANINFLKKQLEESKAGNASRLNYVVRSDFDFVSSFGKSTVDLVFSQAAFEHFDNIELTISRLSEVCKSDAILVAEIDLKAHSRWIRDKDPNNIYRYPNYLYSIFAFPGIPNRVRPFQYADILGRYGWTDISITPIKKLPAHRSKLSGINSTYADSKNQMDYLSIMLFAKKG